MSTDFGLLLVQGVVLAVSQLVLSQQQSGWSSDVKHPVSGWFTQLGHPGNQKLIMAVMGCQGINQGQGIHIFWVPAAVSFVDTKVWRWSWKLPPSSTTRRWRPWRRSRVVEKCCANCLLCFYWSALADNLGMTNKLLMVLEADHLKMFCLKVHLHYEMWQKYSFFALRSLKVVRKVRIVG